jgi:hypothetical protein
MKGFFSVLQTVKAWTRKMIPDPEIRLFNTHVLLVCGIIHLKQEKSHVTMTELERVTTLASSVVNRGLKHLIDHSLLKRNNDNTFDFANPLPPSIGEISTCNSNVTSDQLDDLKLFMIEKLNLVQLQVPRGKSIGKLAEEVRQYQPKKKPERKGTKKILGDASL